MSVVPFEMPELVEYSFYGHFPDSGSERLPLCLSRRPADPQVLSEALTEQK